MKLYHGGNVEVKTPEIKTLGFYKDFGYGFYCTAFEKQARRWALTKRPKHVVSVYEYISDESIQLLSFPSMTEEWLDFVVDCRRGIPHHYDVVEGPMADDTIWDYVEDFYRRKHYSRSLLGVGEVQVSHASDSLLYRYGFAVIILPK